MINFAPTLKTRRLPARCWRSVFATFYLVKNACTIGGEACLWPLTNIWLPSGSSTTFFVRREELKRNLQIFLPFKYEWESSEKNKGYDEPDIEFIILGVNLKMLLACNDLRQTTTFR